MKPRTRAAHPPRIELRPDNRPLVPPVYQSVKFELETLADTEGVWRQEEPGYSYSRGGNPSTHALELEIADMQGTETAVVVGSGMAAVASALLGLLASGDHVIVFAECYVPTRNFLRTVLARYGVTHTLLSIDDHQGLEKALAGQPTKLVWLESPTNPMLKIADLAFITGAARRHGALTVLDNTFAGVHSHLDCGVDVYVHSLTKYAGGHGDVMGGAIAGPVSLIDSVRRDVNMLGPVLDPHAAFLISRGMKTYYVRRAAAVATATTLAQQLATHPTVRRVHYPGLVDHPGHARGLKQMADSGTVLTIDLVGGPEGVRAFTDALQLFAVTASLGSTESLLVPPQLMGNMSLNSEMLKASGFTPTSIRLSIGLEDPEDLYADLCQALEHAAALAS